MSVIAVQEELIANITAVTVIGAAAVADDITAGTPANRRTSAEVRLMTAERPAHSDPAFPEKNLWRTIFLHLYSDIVHEGPTSAVYVAAVQDMRNLEFVASCLGFRRGSVARLLQRAVEEHGKFRQNTGYVTRRSAPLCISRHGQRLRQGSGDRALRSRYDGPSAGPPQKCTT